MIGRGAASPEKERWESHPGKAEPFRIAGGRAAQPGESWKGVCRYLAFKASRCWLIINHPMDDNPPQLFYWRTAAGQKVNFLLRTFMDCHCPCFGQHVCGAGADAHARIDGREAPVLRANQLFRAVYAEPGQHVIIFYYRQQGLLAGMLISAITLVALLWVYLRG